jgi:hypothetical protein
LLVAVADPVLPDSASLEALPPLALLLWVWVWLPPVADELLVEVALDVALELPDVALPPVLEPDPDPLFELLELALALPVLPLAPPEEAPELLLLFDAFPLPETL